jgi:hypothetical protein
VKVMLRVSDNAPTTADGATLAHHLSIDKKKRQVTLCEPTTGQGTSQNQSPSVTERGPMVSAPKMFAFDALHTSDDSQVNRRRLISAEQFPSLSLTHFTANEAPPATAVHDMHDKCVTMSSNYYRAPFDIALGTALSLA